MKNNIYRILAVLVILSSPLYAQTAISLPEAIKLSQDHAYGVKSSRTDSLSAASDYRAAKASRYPTLSLSATSYYLDETQEITIIPTNPMEIGAHENYLAKLTLTLPLYAGGRISRQIDIQRELVNTKLYGLESSKLKNAYLTRKSYLNLMACDAITRASESSLERVKSILNDVQNRYNVGMADSLDILEAEIALLKAQNKLDEAKTTRNNAKSVLSQLLGFTEPTNWVLSENAPTPNLDKYHPAIDDSAAIIRPELKQLESSARVSQKSVSLYKANLYPSLNAFGTYTNGKPNNNMFENEWNDQFTTGLSLTWDFNLGGKTFRNIQSAKYKAKMAEYDRQELQESLLYQSKIALENLRQAYRSYISAGEEYQNAVQKFRLAKEKQKAGNLAVNRLIEQEDDLTSTEQLYEASKINYYIYETEYFYAIGSELIYGGLQNEID